MCVSRPDTGRNPNEGLKNNKTIHTFEDQSQDYKTQNSKILFVIELLRHQKHEVVLYSSSISSYRMIHSKYLNNTSKMDVDWCFSKNTPKLRLIFYVWLYLIPYKHFHFLDKCTKIKSGMCFRIILHFFLHYL